ncbi:hypothetical protein H0H81_003605 [Sphagnurus paluster]|uniref:Uncharacterized protein n=1 Tax=Sphagnurus paluster TaxID=117069 RepID=A0A9P7FSU6_9AGAR|nr:hypothetical protein H0H81_003605 [Sphagnurus paluster]
MSLVRTLRSMVDAATMPIVLSIQTNENKSIRKKWDSYIYRATSIIGGTLPPAKLHRENSIKKPNTQKTIPAMSLDVPKAGFEPCRAVSETAGEFKIVTGSDTVQT